MNGIQRGLTIRSLRDQIPNALTISRLILGLCFFWLPAGAWLSALIWGSLSEFLDGFLARRMNAMSAFGQLMDPVADKIFVMAAALTFLNAGWITLPQLLFMASRDLFVAAASLILLLMGKHHAFRHMAPAPLGKWTTGFQLATLFGVPLLREFNIFLIYATGFISVLAAIDYARRFLQRARD
jgi:CDP-diacylglycerol--glycerol-3-phosphate 3-phosphatidyltransferase